MSVSMRTLALAAMVGAFSAGGICPVATARVTLPALFSEHAVLQRSDRVPVWGQADPGERVTVSFGAASGSGVAASDGRWRVWLDLSAAPGEAGELTVEGRDRLTVADVIVGEVWLCSGQSNMEWSLAASAGAEEEIARPANPHLRQFLVKRSGPAKPLDECEGRWTVAGPGTVAKFSGVAYYFGQHVARGTGRAVGLISASAGGTPIEAWMSAETIAQDAGWQAGVAATERAEREYPERLQQHVAAVEAWLAKYDRRDRPAAAVAEFVGPAARGAAWRPTEIVEALDGAGLPDGGAIWLRKKVIVPRVEAVGLERGFQLSLGVMRGADTVYWNGRKIGGTDITAPGALSLRRYQVPPELLEREREATLTIRLFYPHGGPSLTVPNDPPLVANSVPIDGMWEVRVEFALEPLRDGKVAPFPTPPARPRAAPSRSFNGMIAPLVPYALRGAIWYQGEANVARAAHYPNSFALMVNDWRARWERGDFPVYFCQLPNYNAKHAEPRESGWAAFREQQARCLAVPATALAVTIDLGAERELHPRNKRDVGERLARLALARTYGQAIADRGPTMRAATREGPSWRITFDHVASGLVARTLPATHAPDSLRPDRTRPLVARRPFGSLEGFAICSEDRRWHWAGATIDGDSVVVSSPAVANPVAVRYAWADNPTCNLYNHAGLPATPFRTDTFSP